MPIGSYSSGLLATTLLALLLLPAQYYVPEWGQGGGGEPPAAPRAAPRAPPARAAGTAWPLPAGWPALDAVYFPTLDLVFTFSLLLLGACTYLCEWVQRKLMERRILKLNQYLGASVERLAAWDAQQEHLEATLRMVQNATSEYNLLLYLLLRQHRCLPPAARRAQPSAPHPHLHPHPQQHPNPSDTCFFEKGDDDFSYLRAPMVDV